MRRWIVSHPTGNLNVRGLLSVLEGEGMLEKFLTTLGVSRDAHLLPGLFPLLKRRRYELAADKLKTWPVLELRRMTSDRWFRKSLPRQRVDRLYVDFDRRAAGFLRRCAHESGALGVYAYEDGALEQFQFANSAGIPAAYDLPIGYWRAARRILTEESELLPEWAATMAAVSEPEWKRERKDGELSLANDVYVASRFTAETLREFPGPMPELKVIPYGGVSGLTPLSEPRPAPSRPRCLRALFVGALSQRKGLHYLFQAAAQLGSAVEWTFIGQRVGDCPLRDRLLAPHRWIKSLPHAAVLDQMKQHDVLVFPSLFEGFGLVILEAMACGVPIITTPHTAAPDLFEDGYAGFIVPVRDSQAIAVALQRLIDEPERLDEMKRNALRTAEDWTWERYSRTLLPAIQKHG